MNINEILNLLTEEEKKMIASAMRNIKNASYACRMTTGEDGMPINGDFIAYPVSSKYLPMLKAIWDKMNKVNATIVFNYQDQSWWKPTPRAVLYVGCDYDEIIRKEGENEIH